MKNRRIVICGASGVGKAQPLDEPVLTKKGWKNMGDLTLKDWIIDPVTGSPIRLLGIYDRGILPVYKLSFSDGTYTRVSKDHLWEVIKKSHNQYKSYVVDTRCLIETYKKKSGGNRYSIPNTVPITFSKVKALPIHPYILGFILGDGCITGDKKIVRVSTNIVDSQEVIGRLKEFGGIQILGEKDYPDKGTTHFRIHGLGEQLKELGLLGCRSNNKFIPDIYLNASIEDRKLLLAGLLDTDGSTPSSKKKAKTCINYSSTSPYLAKQVAYILRSLGEVASIHECDRTPEGKAVTYSVHCNITFNYMRGYKKAILNSHMLTSKRRNRKVKKIIDISYVGDLPVRCIKVDSERGLYLTRDFIVTHNTTVARAISEEFGIKYVSGSLYDLMPNLPKNHYDLNTKYDTNEKHKRNFQILNLRYHQYMELEGSFVTDRSLYDTAGYEIQENSMGLPTCETHDFIEKINAINYDLMLKEKEITHIIFIPYKRDQFERWEFEKDGKRITNKYFQYMVSACQTLVFNVIGVDQSFGQLIRNIFSKNKVGTLFVHDTDWEAEEGYDPIDGIKLLELNEMDHSKRMKAIRKFLK